MDIANTASEASRSSSHMWLQILRLLFFRANRDDLTNLSYKYLAAGLLCTWIVGMGRYWDDPCAYPLQHLGLGSVFYVFVLAFLLWLFILPLKPAQWSYRQVLTYVTLTSPPAIIYAIPVEHFLSMKVATNANLYFLIIVAVWRVLLMAQYLRLVARLPLLHRFVGMLFPVTTVITLLFLLDQHRAVFEVMGGFRHHLNPREGADIFLNEVVGCSAVICPIAALCYFVMVCFAWRREFRNLVYRHRITGSLLSLFLVSGITYGTVRCVNRSPSEKLCDSVYALGSPEEKEALYSKAISMDPSNAKAFAGRAWFEQIDGRYAAALADDNRAVDLDRSNCEYLSQRAYLLKELGRFAESLHDLRAARKFSTTSSLVGAALPFSNLNGFERLKDNSNILANAASWQLKQDIFWQQFDDLAWIRMPHDSIDRMDSWALIEEVPMLWQLRRLDEALRDCNLLVDRFYLARGSGPASSQSDGYVEDTALAKAYRMRGYTCQLLGQKAQALSDYERALRIVKDDQKALFLKARLLRELGREQESRDSLLLCKSAISKNDLGDSSKYIELLSLAELGEQKEAALRLIGHPPTTKPANTSDGTTTNGRLHSSEEVRELPSEKAASALQAHVGGTWWGYLDDDYSLPAKLWETGKFYELLGMKTLARERFLSAIVWMDQHTPKTKNRLNFLLWRTRILLALGDKNRAAGAFHQACSLGYGGIMPSDDLSSIDADLLVMRQDRQVTE